MENHGNNQDGLEENQGTGEESRNIGTENGEMNWIGIVPSMV